MASDPIYLLVGYDPIAAGGAYFAGEMAGPMSWSDTAAAAGTSSLGLILVNAWGVVWLLAKALGLIFVQIWIRWTLPRIRIDQVLHTCVKVLLPASLVMLLGTAVWLAMIPQPIAVDAPAGAPASLGHLTAQTPFIQAWTQNILATIGAILILTVVAYVALAWFRADRHPRKTLFEDVMPVGNQVAFTRSQDSQAAS